MKEVDKRNKLDEGVFSFQANKDDSKVFIYWRGKQVKVLKDKEAKKFLDRIVGLEDKEVQLVMAKLTGNFKRGNERNKTKHINF